MAVTVSNDHPGKRLAQRPDTTMKQSLRKVIHSRRAGQPPQGRVEHTRRLPAPIASFSNLPHRTSLTLGAKLAAVAL